MGTKAIRPPRRLTRLSVSQDFECGPPVGCTRREPFQMLIFVMRGAATVVVHTGLLKQRSLYSTFLSVLELAKSCGARRHAAWL